MALLQYVYKSIVKVVLQKLSQTSHWDADHLSCLGGKWCSIPLRRTRITETSLSSTISCVLPNKPPLQYLSEIQEVSSWQQTKILFCKVAWLCTRACIHNSSALLKENFHAYCRSPVDNTQLSFFNVICGILSERVFWLQLFKFVDVLLNLINRWNPCSCFKGMCQLSNRMVTSN